MTDEEDSQSVSDELLERSTDSLSKAQAVHNQISEYKEWAVDEAAEIRVRAEVLHENDEISDDDYNQILSMAARIREVHERISDDG